MSKYTTEVRSICEVAAGLTESLGYNSINDILKQAAPNVFNFDWPIFDEAYRLPLEIKILKHFYTREIGLETVGLWKLKLDTKLNEIMPYYNQLYKSELIEFNPLYDVDITRDHKGENTGNHKTDGGHNDNKDYTENYKSAYTGNITKNDTRDLESTKTTDAQTDTTSESETTGTNNQSTNNTTTESTKNTDRYSDTPQGAITNLENNTYLTNARIIDGNIQNNLTGSVDNNSNVCYNDSSNTTNNITEENKTGETLDSSVNESRNTDDNKTSNESSNGTNYAYTNITDTTKYLEHVTGKQGTASYSKMLQEYRETFLNIDMLVIGELEPLFMQLW